MLHDSHTHLYSLENLEEVVEKCKKEGLKAILTCGEDLKTSEKCVRIAESYEIVYPAVGIHPCARNEEWSDKILEKAVAVGEIGLDGKCGVENQKKRFENMLRIAEAHSLPVIVHSREAHSDVFKMLASFEGTVVLHWFSGSVEQVVEGVERGYYFSFGPWTLKYPVYETIIDVVPLERILLETDTPVGNARPWDVRDVVSKIAEVKKIDEENVIEKTWKNSKKVFGW